MSIAYESTPKHHVKQHIAEKIVADLRTYRKTLESNGHDVSRMSIGYFDGQLRLADDTGAYDFGYDDAHGLYHTCVGFPGKCTQWLAWTFNGSRYV